MIERLGVLEDGREVQAVTLGASDALQAQVLSYGGILRSLRFPTRDGVRDLIVTLPTLDAYVRDTTFQGVIAGRVANRIADARFTLDGRMWQLAANDGANQLHGGHAGFGKALWRVIGLQSAPRHRVLLGLSSPAGDEGYPSNLQVTVEILVEGNELRIHFEAESDETTPLNLTWHPYFNFAGDSTRAVSKMRLRIAASSFLPVRDSQLIPTGEIAAVDGTPFDFRSPRILEPPPLGAHAQLGFASGYDHCWVLDPDRDCDAELVCAETRLRMTIHSDRPGIQFYGGQHLRTAYLGTNGICLEPQGFPNAVNEPAFPSSLLKAGETYRSTFIYRFSD